LGVSDVIRVGLHESLTLPFPALQRVAVGNAGLLRVKAVGKGSVVLFGKKEGRTTLTLWDRKESVTHHSVEIVPFRGGDLSASEGRLIRVLLEFIEFDRRKFEELGIRLPSQESFSFTVGVAENVMGLNLAGQVLSAQGFFHHFAQNGEAKLMASPELFVREGEEASFHSGGELPIHTSRDKDGRSHRYVDWKPFGVNLKVRPKSYDGFHISSDIKVEVSELNAGLAVEGIPSLSKRTIDTKVDSLDRETLLLSGLHRTRESRGGEQVPLVDQLPIVGPLFKVRRRESESSELLVALTLSFAGKKGAERLDRMKAPEKDLGNAE